MCGYDVLIEEGERDVWRGGAGKIWRRRRRNSVKVRRIGRGKKNRRRRGVKSKFQPLCVLLKV